MRRPRLTELDQTVQFDGYSAMRLWMYWRSWSISFVASNGNIGLCFADVVELKHYAYDLSPSYPRRCCFSDEGTGGSPRPLSG